MWCLPGDKVGKSDVDFAKSACLILPKAYHPRFKQGTITTGVQYTPKMGDIVVGIISAKFADGFRVNIKSHVDAHISITAFQNATKQHYPNLSVGSVILCGVSSAHPDYDTMLTCLAVEDAKGWTTGETYLGELSGGFYFDTTLAYADVLLGTKCLVISIIGRHLPFEVAVGSNGRVWVRGRTCRETVAIARAIELCRTTERVEEMNRVIESVLINQSVSV